MLILQSDLLRAVCLSLHAAISLAKGTIASNSTFCQISGFFLTAAIEGCDVAIVLVALHIALYVLGSGSGLDRHRRVAYAIFTVLPLSLTSLAFVNRPAFTNSGQFCYLPTTRGWTGRAVSWIPRYVIFVALPLSYACIYCYVSVILEASEAVGSGRHDSLSASGGRDPRRHSVPPTPPLEYHGLIPSTPTPSDDRDREAGGQSRRSSNWTVPFFDRRLRRVSTASMLPTKSEVVESQGMKWILPRFGLDSAYSSGDPDLSTRAGPVVPRRRSVPVTGTVSRTSNVNGDGAPGMAPKSRTASPVPSQHDITTILRRGPSTETPQTSPSVVLTITAFEQTGMTKKRDNVRQQARLLFIYPLVYLAMWLCPFILHIMGGEDRHAPFGLVAVSLFSMCIQGSCDALVFCVKERPWKHVVPGTTDVFHCRFWRAQTGHGNDSIGRTQEEMILDGSIARRRRDDERTQRQLEGLLGPSAGQEWWEPLENQIERPNRAVKPVSRSTVADGRGN